MGLPAGILGLVVIALIAWGFWMTKVHLTKKK